MQFTTAFSVTPPPKVPMSMSFQLGLPAQKPLRNTNRNNNNSAIAPPPPQPVLSKPAPLPNEPSSNGDETKSWGAATWILLHTMAEKCRKDSFSRDLLEVIFTICANLPCPDCCEHAKRYLNSNNFMRVSSAEDLKTFLFQFHNTVNARKQKPIFTRDQLPVYATANFNNVVVNFFNFYRDKVKTNRYLATEMFRERVILKLQEWFRQNNNNMFQVSN